MSTVAGGRLIGAVPKALAAGGLHGAAGHGALAAAAVLVGAFALGQTMDAILFACAQGFSMRVLGEVHRRAMVASLAPAELDSLTTPEHRRLLDLAEHDRWPNMYAFVSGLRRLITFRVIALTSAFLVARFDWRLALGLVAVYTLVGHRLRRRQREAISYGDEPVRRAHYFRETALSAEAAKELRVFGLVPWMLSNFDAEWRNGMAPVWRARRASAAEVVALLAVILTANVVAFTVVADAARSQRIGAPTVLVVVSAALALSQLGLVMPEDDHVAQGAQVAGALERGVARSLSHAPGAGKPLPTPRAHELRVEDLRFAYPGQTRPLYDGLNLVAPAGRSLAIVGANGAGKTTLVKLLAGLHRPESGRILADGVDIRDLDAAAWQHRLAAIFQDFTHYPMSAADNVGFGAIGRHLGHDRDLLDRAAER
ncbi:MAG: ATP-binding cassette domain-containing protein, partial [Acidimicrobiales bacterium]